VVGFNAVLMSEHFGAFITFVVMHVVLAVQFIRDMLPERQFQVATRLVLTGGIAGVVVVLTVMVAYVASSPTLGWTGRWCCLWWCIWPEIYVWW
jgi:dolichyl-diphosphooligosaccharide--protein glycosyltransferase